MRRTAARIAFATVSVTAAVTLLSACGSDEPADAGRHADPAALAWVDKVCSGVATASAKLSQPPAFAPADPQKTKTAMVGFLNSLSAALDDMAGGIRNAGVPPVPEGQSAVDKATTTLGETKSKVTDTLTKMQGAPVTDQASLQKVVADADTTMSGLSEPEGPIKHLRANAELDLAFTESPTCRQVYGGNA
ncbi:hypothetical protein SD37_23870 [Amycolatopsis orientalis]|uniref:Small secreted protein n=1 Tax=Amycolatopsis orientalis TaxID=31958 RepID=A0A193C1H5_AMYOR|nr:hypothetical protein [Amycolatopsis orientalis]ANN18371.1 hypothetical protein SD37_23870 [Amycolatopsis orientalis]